MNWKHPSVIASLGALVVLAVIELATDLPLWLWAAWAVLTAVSVVQAGRDRRAA